MKGGEEDRGPLWRGRTERAWWPGYAGRAARRRGANEKSRARTTEALLFAPLLLAAGRLWRPPGPAFTPRSSRVDTRGRVVGARAPKAARATGPVCRTTMPVDAASSRPDDGHGWPGYSARSASTGLRRLARVAGMPLAKNTTTITRADAAAKTHGDLGSIWKRRSRSGPPPCPGPALLSVSVL